MFCALALLSALAVPLPCSAQVPGFEPSRAVELGSGSTLGWSAALTRLVVDGEPQSVLVLGDPARNAFTAVPLGEAAPFEPEWSAKHLLGASGSKPYVGLAVTALPDSEGRARARLAFPFGEYGDPVDGLSPISLALVDVASALSSEPEPTLVPLGQTEWVRAVFVRSVSEDLGLDVPGPGARNEFVGRDLLAVVATTGSTSVGRRTYVWVVAADEGAVVAERQIEGDSFTSGEPVSWLPDLDGDERPDLALGVGVATGTSEEHRLLLLDSRNLETLHSHADPVGPGRVFGAAVEYLGRDAGGRALLAVGAPLRRSNPDRGPAARATSGDAAVEVYALSESGDRLAPVAAFSSAVRLASPALIGVFPFRSDGETVGWTASSGVAYGEAAPWLAISEPEVKRSFETSGALMAARWVDGRWRPWFGEAHRLGTPREMEWELGYRIQAFSDRDAHGALRRILVATTANPTLRQARVVVLDADDGELIGEYCVLE